MRLEPERPQIRPAQTGGGLRKSEEAACRWLVRFMPLLDPPDELGAQECRRRIDSVPELRASGGRLLADLELYAGPEAGELVVTFREAFRQLDGLEAELQRRLGLIAPDDPEAILDLARVRSRLAEAAARREVEALVGSNGSTDRLELKVSPGSLGSALFMGIFSVGWLAFTSVHAWLMVQGMMAAFGPPALALLAFYAIFWAVGIGMGWGAVRSACSEFLELRGRELTLRMRTPLYAWQRTYRLGPESRAYITTAGMQQQGSRATEVALQDEKGRDIRFAQGRPFTEQERLVNRLNEYLASL